MTRKRRYPVDHGAPVKVTAYRSPTQRSFRGRLTSYNGRFATVRLDTIEDPDAPEDEDASEAVEAPRYAASFVQWAETTPIGEQVWEARVARQFTQDELGSRAGTSGGYICKVERGLVMPNGNTLARLARALGVALVVGPKHGELKYKGKRRVPAHRKYKRRTAYT